MQTHITTDKYVSIGKCYGHDLMQFYEIYVDFNVKIKRRLTNSTGNAFVRINGTDVIDVCLFV